MNCLHDVHRGEEHEHLESIMAFYERRSSRKIIRHWRGRRARIKRAEAEEARRQRALAKEKARQESVLRVDVDEEDGNSDAAPVSPVRTQPDDEDEEEEEEEESDISDEGVERLQDDARVGANLT